MKRWSVAVATTAAMLGLVSVGAPAQAKVLESNSRIVSPGSNGKITYTQWGPDDEASGFTIDPDGSHQYQIGPSGNVSCGTWSPDGSTLLCNVWGEGGAQPATANPDGSDFALLNPNLPFDLFCSFWSPNGARLICHSEGIANQDDAGLYTARSSDAGDLVRVTATPADGFYDVPYGYSADGSHILFSRFNSNGRGVLFSVKPDGSGGRQLSPAGLTVVDPEFFDTAAASWSPDGSQVTFAGTWKEFPGRETALYVVKGDGAGLRQVTPSGVGALSAQWSPDGSVIAFSGKRFSGHPPWQIWVVHPDGAGLREVTNARDGASSLTPVWSPDGAKLLFNRMEKNGDWSLSTINADGTGVSILTDLFNHTSYAWGRLPLAKTE